MVVQEVVGMQRGDGGERRKDMFDMQTLAARKDACGDARTSAGELSIAAALDIHAAAGWVRTVLAGRREGARSAEFLAAGHDGLSRRMWLLMLEQGGRWTAAELAEKCGVPVKKAESLAAFMVRSRTAKKVRSGKRKNGVAYMVTEGCEVPRGMNLGALLQATGMRLWGA